MIKEYKLKDGSKRYMVKMYIGTDSLTGREKHTTRRGFKTIKEAKLAEARIKINAENEEFDQKKPLTFKQVYDLFMVEHKNTVKPGTYNTTKRYAKLHILPKIANTRVDKLSIINCQRLVNQWANHFNSAKYPCGIVIQVLDYAMKLEIVQSNNMKKIKLPKTKEKKVDFNKFYTTDELKHFFECLEDYDNLKFKAFFRLLAFTGARKGEVIALTWKDIDFKLKFITINKGVALDESNKPYITTPKTKKSVRKISIDDETLNVLKLWKNEQAIELLKRGFNAMNTDQLLFSYQDNRIYTPSYLNTWLNLIIEKYNLKPITLHGFRHSHCSLLFEMGTPIQVVQERLGHSNIKTTMDIYTHVTEKQRDQLADNFAKYVNF